MKNLTRRKFLEISLGTLALGAWAANAGLAQPAGRPIRIGHQLDLTGAVEGFAKWHNRAIEAAIKRLNEQKGIAGRPVELVNSEDCQSRPDIGKEQFAKLVNQKGVDFVIGSVFSGTNIATAPLAKELKTVYFPQGIATSITGTQGNRYIFKSYHSVRAAIEAGYRWALEHLGKRWTIIASDLEFAKSQAEDFSAKIREAGGEIVDIITVPFRATDFLAALNKINLARTEALYQAFTAVDTVRFMPAAFELGIMRRMPVLGLIEGIDILDVRAPAYEGTYYITSYPRRSDQVPPDRTKLDLFYRARVGIGPDGKSPDGKEVVPIADLFGSWQAVHLIKLGVEKSGWGAQKENPAFIQALEERSILPADEGFPQGEQFLRAQDHLSFHSHYIERVEGGNLTVKERLPEGLYPPLVDYTKEGF
jgi:branched-chain amino acid transport system substrate-binding protein